MNRRSPLRTYLPWLLACAALGALVVGFIGGVSWLLKDLSQAAIIDGRNKILWKLKLHGSIARWPDVLTEFPLVVAPGKEDG